MTAAGNGPPTSAAASQPADAVRSWWAAMGAGDLDGLAALALEDHVSAGGPDGRQLGRAALLEGAAAFFADATIATWDVADVEVRRHGDVAVCSYRWSERGDHAGSAFALAGVATDVLVRCEDGRWRVQAHHVSMGAGPA